jgi:hypothetical protein
MLTIHRLHVLVKYVLAVAEFKCNSDLVTDLDNLAFFEVLTALVRVDDRFTKETSPYAAPSNICTCLLRSLPR